MNEMATKTKRRRPDVFTDSEVHGDSVADAIHHALLPLDRAASEMEMKWGCERLPSLVAPATASLFGSAKAKLDAAIQANDPQEVARRAAVMIRGWSKMDAEATERGHKALSPDIWCHTTQGGLKVAIARSGAEAGKASKMESLQNVRIYSLDEIGRILDHDSLKLVNATKDVFPGAEIKKIRKKAPASKFDDEVPF
tara:strand:+ start:105 stop:695 length:591 start_codon:yes stop_codon:yes gene_type:complete